ncbi:MAG: PAS domain S-box protein, partial [Alphaproteobacteria bacterium]|nr:PAS domain S-box protein [Alphaproteobacteria bacterium]
IVIGPRRGRFDADGRPQPIPGSNQAVAVFGVLVLLFGWFGFNGGSTLGDMEIVPRVVGNTVLSAASGVMSVLVLSAVLREKVDSLLTMNGVIAGLVAVTANAHAVSAAAAVAIGFIGGLLMVACRRGLLALRIDDVVSAVPVHLAGGIWGTLAVAIFADLTLLGTGLGRVEQLAVQALGIVVCGVWSFGIGFVAIKLLNRFIQLRVPPDDEQMGLNVAEHGAITEIFELQVDMAAQADSGDITQRLRVEPFTEIGQIAALYNRVMDTLEHAVAKSDSIVRSASDGIITFTRNTLMIDSANPAAEAMFGLSAADLVGRPMTELLTFDGRGGQARRTEQAELLRQLSGGGHTEVVAKRSDGLHLDVEVSVASAEATGDAFSTAIFHDITERKRAEEAVQESEFRLLQAQRLALMGDWEADLKTGEQVWSEPLYEILGVPKSTPASYEAFIKAVHPEDRARVAATQEEAFEKGEAFTQEYRVLDQGGTVRIILTRNELVRYADGVPVRAIGTAQDITERKRAEEALKESEQRFASMLMDSPIGVSVARIRDGKFLYANTRILEMFKVDEKEFQRLPPSSYYAHAEDLEEVKRLMQQQGFVNNHEVELTKTDGSHFWVSASILPIDYLGEPSRLAWFFDITDRKRAEAELAEKEAQLRSALENISGGIYMVDKDLNFQVFNDNFRTLYEIPDGVIRKGAPIRNVVAIRAGRGDYGPGDPEELAAARLSGLFDPETQFIEDRVPSGRVIENKRTLTDDGGIVSVFVDVTDRVNAAEELERGEVADFGGLRILVVARDKEVGGFLGRYLKHWKAEVRNTASLERVRKMALEAAGKDRPFNIIVLGAMWSEAEHASVCEGIRGTPELFGTRFVRLSFDRVLDHRLAARDSALISASPMRRSTFLTAVAVAAGRQSPEVREREEAVDLPHVDPPTPAEAEAAGRLILVAEDNAINQAVILRQVNRLGYAAEVADDGRQALEVWKSRSFALVLTDCHMPEMDGFQLTAAIREAEGAGSERVPIIAITANALLGEADRCLAAGMDDYLSKPVELLHLRKVLAQWLPPAAGEVAPPTESIGLPESRAEPPPQSDGPVDMAGFGRLLGSDDSVYLSEMLVFFWESVADTPPQLEALTRARDAAGLKEAAHAAKGAARSATAEALATALQDLETAAVAADWSAVEAMAPRIEREFSAVEEYIREIAARQN